MQTQSFKYDTSYIPLTIHPLQFILTCFVSSVEKIFKDMRGILIRRIVFHHPSPINTLDAMMEKGKPFVPSIQAWRVYPMLCIGESQMLRMSIFLMVVSMISGETDYLENYEAETGHLILFIFLGLALGASIPRVLSAINVSLPYTV